MYFMWRSLYNLIKLHLGENTRNNFMRLLIKQKNREAQKCSLA